MAEDFCLLSRRGNRRIAGYVAVTATKKASQNAQVIVSHSLVVCLR